MTKLYNLPSKKQARRRLRKNMTKAEVLIWIQLKNKQLLGERVLRQFSIGRYIVDFYIPRIKLAIEIDGATHSTERELTYDKKRQDEIENLGIAFLRFTNSQVYSEMDEVLGEIRKKVKVLSGDGTIPLPQRASTFSFPK